MSLRPFTPESGRQSPFKRQNSTASARATTPTLTTNPSPTKPSPLSPNKASSLSPQKASPFVRRPSQISQTSDRPASPFGRPGSGLSPATGSRQTSPALRDDDTPPASPRMLNTTPTLLDRSAERNIAAISPYDGPALDSPSLPASVQRNMRSSVQRPEPATTPASAIKPPSFVNRTAAPKLANPTTTGYNHIAAPLLRSMRESFEVLDSSNTGSVTSASVASMLEQMGLSNTPADVRDFFPPNGPAQLNLARYLDSLSGPLAELSQSEELAAAFSAFDVDDSGQIDIAELRNALANTAPERGQSLSDREIDGVLGEFAGRRAFGAKGVNVAKGKGDVFRWREFMGSVTGGGAGGGAESVPAV